MDKNYSDFVYNADGGTVRRIYKAVQGKEEAAFRGYLALKEKLSEELVQELESMMDAQMEALTLEMEERYAEGFKTGAKLMCEVFGKEENK